MFADLAADLGRCGDTTWRQLYELMVTPGMWSVVGYRFRRWLSAHRLPRPFCWVVTAVMILVQLAAEVATGIQLPTSARIGPGLYVPHSGCIVVSSGATIGRHCTLTQGVTIGHAGGGTRHKSGCPTIGDRVYVGPNASIIGPISVGDDALVGVGAVVVRSVPRCGVVAGNPARLISMAGSFDLIEYPRMEADASRIAAMDEADRRPADSRLAVI